MSKKQELQKMSSCNWAKTFVCVMLASSFMPSSVYGLQFTDCGEFRIRTGSSRIHQDSPISFLLL